MEKSFLTKTIERLRITKISRQARNDSLGVSFRAQRSEVEKSYFCYYYFFSNFAKNLHHEKAIIITNRGDPYIGQLLQKDRNNK